MWHVCAEFDVILCLFLPWRNSYGQFGWDAGDEIGSTFPFSEDGQEEPFNLKVEGDWYDRFHQYYETYNDR